MTMTVNIRHIQGDDKILKVERVFNNDSIGVGTVVKYLFPHTTIDLNIWDGVSIEITELEFDREKTVDLPADECIYTNTI